MYDFGWISTKFWIQFLLWPMITSVTFSNFLHFLCAILIYTQGTSIDGIGNLGNFVKNEVTSHKQCGALEFDIWFRVQASSRKMLFLSLCSSRLCFSSNANCGWPLNRVCSISSCFYWWEPDQDFLLHQLNILPIARGSSNTC